MPLSVPGLAVRARGGECWAAAFCSPTQVKEDFCSTCGLVRVSVARWAGLYLELCSALRGDVGIASQECLLQTNSDQ